MTFRPLKTVTARWLALEGEGSEHLSLEQNSGRITATAVLIGENGNGAFGAWYQLFLDRQWRIKALSVHLTDSRWFIVKSRKAGEWADGDGRKIDALAACTDIDLAASPFTNTCAIRRLDLAAGDSRDIDVVFLPFDTLEPRRVRQRYTCLEPGARYRYESLASGYTVELTTDRDGLVTDYPGVFKRLS
jgi:hypothetical protein